VTRHDDVERFPTDTRVPNPADKPLPSIACIHVRRFLATFYAASCDFGDN